MTIVIAFLLIILGTWWMSELLRKRRDLAEANPERWAKEWEEAKGKPDPWPYTSQINRLGFVLRQVKAFFPILGGIFFFMAVMKI